jgi:hypothetical protein
MWKENKPLEKVKNLKRPQKLRKTQYGKRKANVPGLSTPKIFKKLLLTLTIDHLHPVKLWAGLVLRDVEVF